jgi:hypothetical protein
MVYFFFFQSFFLLISFNMPRLDTVIDRIILTSFLNDLFLFLVPYGPSITKSTKSIDGLKYVTPIPMTIGDNLTALVNATITIRCKGSGLPLPKISWTRDGVKITSKGHVIIGKENLRIQKASLSDQGVYKCTASSDAGSVSASSLVTIKGKVAATVAVGVDVGVAATAAAVSSSSNSSSSSSSNSSSSSSSSNSSSSRSSNSSSSSSSNSSSSRSSRTAAAAQQQPQQ